MTIQTPIQGWSTVAVFTLDGARPRPKKRPRVTRNGTYTPRETTGHENDLAVKARDAMKHRPPAETEVAVVVLFEQATKIRADIDNLAKTVTDAMNGIVYADDSQIVELRVRLIRGAGRDCTTVGVFAP